MMKCPGCNNTHWIRSAPRGFADRLAILRLKRPYRCLKCNSVRLASIFTDFTSDPDEHKFNLAQTVMWELKCPECGGRVRRSRRNVLERLVFFVRAYRCLACRTRFRRFTLV